MSEFCSILAFQSFIFPLRNLFNIYRDIFTSQLSPHELEFGHVMENDHRWEERYEKKDLKDNRHQGKVKCSSFFCHLVDLFSVLLF